MPRQTVPTLHLHVTKDIAARIKRRAAQARQPVSRYLAELVNRDVGQDWPEGYFESISGKSVEAAVPIPFERSGAPEERLPLE